MDIFQKNFMCKNLLEKDFQNLNVGEKQHENLCRVCAVLKLVQLYS